MRVTKVLSDNQKFVAVEVTAEFHGGYHREVGFSSCNFEEGDKFNYSVGYKLALLRAMDKIGKKIYKDLPDDIKETAPFGPPPIPEVKQESVMTLEKDHTVINISDHSKATVYRRARVDGSEWYTIVITSNSNKTNIGVHQVETIDEAMKIMYSYV